MTVTFHNLRVSIDGCGGPKEAYDRLCNALASIEDKGRAVSWHSDTFDVDDGEPEDTLTVMPTEDEAGIRVRKDE